MYVCYSLLKVILLYTREIAQESVLASPTFQSRDCTHLRLRGYLNLLSDGKHDFVRDFSLLDLSFNLNFIQWSDEEITIPIFLKHSGSQLVYVDKQCVAKMLSDTLGS